MKAFIITLMKDVWSLSYAERCLQSIQDTESEIEATLFDATTPETIFPVAWTWPTGKKITCSKTNLLLTPYKTYDNNKRIAAAQSHYKLWKHCVGINEPIMILEHDAIFTHKFEAPSTTLNVGAYSINDPKGATFKSKDYSNKVKEGFNTVPWVAPENIPQGLPGHSAYVITPWAARDIIEKQDSIGWWPNDAIMCKQLCEWLYVYKPFFTKTQGTKSTTSL
jgi:GR25 family glycosyltransferase involved in LPS biosynthesis